MCNGTFYSVPSEPVLSQPRRRHSSGNISSTLEMLPGLEGFHLDTYSRVSVLVRAHTNTHTRTFTVFHMCETFTTISPSPALCQSVSYAQFLYPTNALVRQKPSSTSDLTLQIPVSRSTHSMTGRSGAPSRLNSTVGLDLGANTNGHAHTHSVAQ